MTAIKDFHLKINLTEETDMKIQLSPTRIIKDAITVWSQPGPEADVLMDLKNLTFRPGSVMELYAFHVLDHLFPEEAAVALKNWFSCLAIGGEIYVSNDDFEYIARAFVGGDISIDLFNDLHNHPHQCTNGNVIKMMKDAGFKEEHIVVWYGGEPKGILKNHFETVLTAKKYE